MSLFEYVSEDEIVFEVSEVKVDVELKISQGKSLLEVLPAPKHKTEDPEIKPIKKIKLEPKKEEKEEKVEEINVRHQLENQDIKELTRKEFVIEKMPAQMNIMELAKRAMNSEQLQQQFSDQKERRKNAMKKYGF